VGNSAVEFSLTSSPTSAGVAVSMLFLNSPLKGAEVSSETATAMEHELAVAIMERVAN